MPWLIQEEHSLLLYLPHQASHIHCFHKMSLILHEPLRPRLARLLQSEETSHWADRHGLPSQSGGDGTFPVPALSHLPTHSCPRRSPSRPSPPPSLVTALSVSPAITFAATWGIKWHYEEMLLAELNCITGAGNIPWERGWWVEERRCLVRESQSRREEKKKKRRS